MYPKDKIMMLNVLRLHEFIGGIPVSGTVWLLPPLLLTSQDDGTIDFLVSVAKLINISGSEVMKAMTKLYGVSDM